MGRGNRKPKRKKSSESDSETKSLRKPFKQGARSQYESIVDVDLSQVLNETNGVLYDSEYTYNKFELLGDCDDAELDLSKDLNSVFSPHTSKNTEQVAENMATGYTPSAQQGSGAPQVGSGGMDSNQFAMLMNMMQGLKQGQDEMTKMFNIKLDRFKNEMLKNINDQVASLRKEIASDVQKQGYRIDEVMFTIQSLKDRVATIEQSQTANTCVPRGDQMETNNGIQDQGQRTFNPSARLDDTDISVIASGLPYDNGEDLLQKAQNLIDALGHEVKTQVRIMKVVRFRARIQDKPGPVKITFRNVQEKIKVLRSKMCLKDLQQYSDVYVKSCKSHAERLIEMNARALLRQMPDGKNFRVDANGRIQPRQQHDNRGNVN